MYERLLLWLGRCALKVLLAVLPGVAAFTTVSGIILTMCLKHEDLAKPVLERYPRYHLGQQAAEILADRKYPTRSGESNTTDVSVLEITHPGFHVILDFIQSDIAIRKSERNEPAMEDLAQPKQTPQKIPPALPPVNFDRIKTVVGIRVNAAKAGPKALVPPYRLLVIYPGSISRRLYEYHSQEEFNLDLKKYFLNELEFRAIVVTLISFLLTSLLMFLRRLSNLGSRETASPAQHTHTVPQQRQPNKTLEETSDSARSAESEAPQD